MAQTMVNIRLDSNLKKDMEKACKEMGLSMTTAFKLFAIKVSRDRRLPFEVCGDPFYSESNLAHLRRGIEALDKGMGKEHEPIQVE